MTTEAASPSRVPPRWLRAAQSLRDRKMLAMVLLSLAAGLPYGAVLGTLNAWLTAEGIKPSTIGVLSFIILAYSFKFIWAPGFQAAWFPRIGLPWIRVLGPRRAWMFVLQLFMAVLLGLLAMVHPAEAIGQVALIGVLVAIASATHDIVLDAWRIEIASSDEDKDLMSALYQFGYRIAGLFTGLFALMASERIGWPATYGAIAVGMALVSCGTLIAPEPTVVAGTLTGTQRPSYRHGLSLPTVRLAVGMVAAGWLISISLIVVFVVQSLGSGPPPSAADFTRYQGPVIVALSVLMPTLIAAFLMQRSPDAIAGADGSFATQIWPDKVASAVFRTVIDPLIDLVSRMKWGLALVMALALTYRFVDLIWGGFAYPFYLGTEHGALAHTPDEVAIASKTIGVLMTILGAATGAAALVFLGRMSCLMVGAVLSAATNLLFADLASGGHAIAGFLQFTGLGGFMEALGANPKLGRLIVAIAGENLAGGFASVAFVAYLTSIVNRQFAAVQYALLASLAMLIGSLGRAELGVFIETSGFQAFFLLTAWLGLVAVGFCALEWMRQAAAPKPASADAIQ